MVSSSTGQRLVRLVDRLARLGLADAARIEAAVPGVEEDGQVAVARAWADTRRRRRARRAWRRPACRRRPACGAAPPAADGGRRRCASGWATSATAPRTSASVSEQPGPRPQRAYSRLLRRAGARSAPSAHTRSPYGTRRRRSGGRLGGGVAERPAQAAARAEAAADERAQQHQPVGGAEQRGAGALGVRHQARRRCRPRWRCPRWRRPSRSGCRRSAARCGPRPAGGAASRRRRCSSPRSG